MVIVDMSIDSVPLSMDLWSLIDGFVFLELIN